MRQKDAGHARAPDWDAHGEGASARPARGAVRGPSRTGRPARASYSVVRRALLQKPTASMLASLSHDVGGTLQIQLTTSTHASHPDVRTPNWGGPRQSSESALSAANGPRLRLTSERVWKAGPRYERCASPHVGASFTEDARETAEEVPQRDREQAQANAPQLAQRYRRAPERQASHLICSRHCVA